MRDFVESGRFESLIERMDLRPIAWLIIVLSVYVFGGAFLRVVGEIFG